MKGGGSIVIVSNQEQGNVVGMFEKSSLSNMRTTCLQYHVTSMLAPLKIILSGAFYSNSYFKRKMNI